MQFFEITHPGYKSDHEADRHNPVELTARYYIARVACGRCGPWSSSTRLRLPWRRVLEDFEGSPFLSIEEWARMRPRWARLLRVKPDEIDPGAYIGPPMGVCRAAIHDDVVHPFSGVLWITERARRVLAKARLKGVSLMKVDLYPSRSRRELFEVVTRGRAWRKGSTPERLRACKRCGRMKFPAPTRLEVDEKRWDGSDLFYVDFNPNILIGTERVASLIEKHEFSNVVAVPIGRRERR